MHINNKRDSSNDKDRSSIVAIGKGVGLAFLISIIALTVYGILLAVTPISEASMSTVIMAIVTISIALASIYTAIRVEARGWLNGAMVGLVYMVLLFLLSLLFKTGVSLDKFILFRMFMGFVIGALAGIIGINLKS